MAQGTGNQFGKYRLIAHLATGGMADIYLASQLSLAGFEKLIVIKRILPNLAREARFVEMFLDEARIAAMLNHPNVVQIFDLGRIDGQYFIAMEYLPGESLSMVIKTCRRNKVALPPQLAAGMVQQAAEGLHHAHTMRAQDGTALNIVHRDVSPQNVFVLYDGGVKVVDFGIAKAALRSTQTRTGTLKGKYAYMSPEQVLGRDLDARSDVYSLGIVLWECLTGRKLYRQENDLELLQAITQEETPSPLTVNSNIPGPLAEITLRALNRILEDRYQSSAELRSALATFLKTQKAESDTMGIGRFMQVTFEDRIKEKNRLIEGARSSEVSMEDYLFGDLAQYASDTEVSVPRSTPGPFLGAGRSLRRRSLGLVIVLLAVLIGGGIAAAILYYKDKNKEDDPGQSDAGLVGPTNPPDAGASPSGDPGNRVAVTDAGTQPPADAGPVALAPADKSARNPKGFKRKRRNRRRRRRKIHAKVDPKLDPKRDPETGPGNDPKKDPEPVKPGPPGKLRLITNPWTDVFYKGRKLGQTPLVDVELPSGMIKLRVVNKDAGIDKTIVVKIDPGKRATHRRNLF